MAQYRLNIDGQITDGAVISITRVTGNRLDGRLVRVSTVGIGPTFKGAVKPGKNQTKPKHKGA